MCRELGYKEWHARVAELLRENHPDCTVIHEQELGGGMNGVVSRTTANRVR